MNDKNVCPHCGGKVVAGFTEFRGVQGYQARCVGCGANGPVIIVASEVWHIEIVDAFCHPRHFMEGKVMVSVEDIQRIVTWFYGDARTVPHADMDETLGKFQAAIDAAGGEK